jgi:ribosomal protein S26
VTKKRRNSGKTGSSKGKGQLVQCHHCSRLVPRAKAKRVTRWVSLCEPQISRELRDAGTIMPRRQETEWSCISCAVHSHKVKIRAATDRNIRDRI